jgi:hypothetical protein
VGTDRAPGQPIFIFGVTMRSGTNFLYDLLLLHPDCAPRPPLVEDGLVFHADGLIQYAETVCGYWKKTFDIDAEEEARFYRCLGDGLSAFLTCKAGGKRVVTKTPTARNLRHFPKLFPEAPLLLIVRDGRAVVESGVKTFPLSFEKATRMWAQNARWILDFLRDHPGALGRKFLLVKYEDLVKDVRGEMTRALTFLGLGPTRYDFAAAENLPVRGSSTFRGESKDVHWKPVEKRPEFQPLRRFSHWGPAKHRRFNWVAGAELAALGYETAAAPARLWDTLCNHALDARWGLRSWSSRNLESVRLRLRRCGQHFRKGDGAAKRALLPT